METRDSAELKNLAGTQSEGEQKELTPEEYRKQLEIYKLQIDIAKGELDLQNLMRKAAESEAAGVFVYNFFEPVDGASVRACISELSTWSRLRPGAPMTIVFNTPGGLVMQGLALYDYLQMLRLSGHHITTVALGRAASMGAVLLQAGDRRIIGPNAFVLLHEVSSGTWGKQSENEESVAFSARLQDKLVKILSRRSKIKPRSLKARWKKTDWWLDAEETVELGYADGVLGADPTDSDIVRFSEPQALDEEDADQNGADGTGANKSAEGEAATPAK